MGCCGETVCWVLVGFIVVAVMVWRWYHSYLIEKNKDFYRNKLVWITGASSGIGRSFALECARRGAGVILSGRNIEALQQVAAECQAVLPHSSSSKNLILCLPFDLASLTAAALSSSSSSSSSSSNPMPTPVDLIPSLLEKIRSHFAESHASSGIVDVLINNAGLSFRGANVFANFDSDVHLMNVNYFSVIAMTKHVAKLWINQKRHGVLLNISSVQGLMGVGNRAAYSASKHALQGYMNSLTYELLPYGISICTICPGYVKTNLSINAVTASGEKHGKLDETTAKGYDPSYVAKRSLDEASIGTRQVILADPFTRLVLLIQYFAPRLLDQGMLKKMKKEA